MGIPASSVNVGDQGTPLSRSDLLGPPKGQAVLSNGKMRGVLRFLPLTPFPNSGPRKVPTFMAYPGEKPDCGDLRIPQHPEAPPQQLGPQEQRTEGRNTPGRGGAAQEMGTCTRSRKPIAACGDVGTVGPPRTEIMLHSPSTSLSCKGEFSPSGRTCAAVSMPESPASQPSLLLFPSPSKCRNSKEHCQEKPGCLGFRRESGVRGPGHLRPESAAGTFYHGTGGATGELLRNNPRCVL